MNKRKNVTYNDEKIVVVSGGFDPFHIGYLKMFKKAKKLGDKLIVILNNDNWIKANKGYIFMNRKDRKEMIDAFACVDEVMLSYHESNPKDVSVCAELEVIRPQIFANGGDKKRNNIPEYELCKDLNIKMVFNVGSIKTKNK